MRHAMKKQKKPMLMRTLAQPVLAVNAESGSVCAKKRPRLGSVWTAACCPASSQPDPAAPQCPTLWRTDALAGPHFPHHKRKSSSPASSATLSGCLRSCVRSCCCSMLCPRASAALGAPLAAAALARAHTHLRCAPPRRAPSCWLGRPNRRRWRARAAVTAKLGAWWVARLRATCAREGSVGVTDSEAFIPVPFPPFLPRA